MLILILFAFLGGVVTILSPCILPILPIILSGSVTGGRQKPLGIVAGFILSFTFFTLFLTSIVNATGLSPDVLRQVAIFILIILGIVIISPQIQAQVEKLFSVLANKLPRSPGRHGFGGGLIIGLSLGLLWTPCVGPILASVISLALTGSVTGSALLITLAYSLGTAIPMLAIMYGGRQLLHRTPWLLNNASKIQKGFGVIMIILALAIYFNYDRKFQAYILDQFPNYGRTLTGLENNNLIKNNLNQIMVDQKKEINGQSKAIKSPAKEIENPAKYPPAPELILGGQWLNSAPLTLAQLQGQVVLLDFMTYSCINCIRTFPYLQSWHEKYQDQGLVVIGIHTPEFEFEKNPANVQKALKDFGLTFPVMQDNDYRTWSAYENHYWPHTFLINHLGQMVYDHIGEGNYEVTENKIKDLLQDRAQALGQVLNDDIRFAGPAPVEPVQVQSPETYFGSSRNEFLANGLTFVAGEQKFIEPNKIELNKLYLVGSWNIQPEYAQNSAAGAKIIFKYSARKVYLVAGAATTANISIKQDGQVVNIKENNASSLDIGQEKLYQLIDNSALQTHTIEIEVNSPGLQAFTFTFG